MILLLDALSDIVKNVAIIILLTTFLDMLLPNNSMQRFIKVVMGLFIMLAILNPVISLFTEDYELSAWQLASLPEYKVETVLAQGEKIAKIQEDQALVEYKNRIEKQIEALVKLVPNVAFVKCEVIVEPIEKIGAIAKIEKAIVWITQGEKIDAQQVVKPVEPVQVQIGIEHDTVTTDKNDPVMEEKIYNIITNYYNLEREDVDLIFN